MKFSVVITTIYLPRVIEQLAINIDYYGRKDDVEILIIGDLKTPSETREYVSRVSRGGYNLEYWDIPAQKEWLARFPDLDNIIPYNSDNRRNIGYLLAYERGKECIITLDDDNYPTDADYFSGHSKVGSTQNCLTVRSSSGWYNICELLDIEGGRRIFPRGYPYSVRFLRDETYDFFCSEGRIVVNAGLWLGDPDVDAVTRLNSPVQAIAINRDSLALDRSTNCPFNAQNTAFHQDILPAYYYVGMGHYLGGLRIDRYGDIWASFLSRKVIDKMGDRVAFGLPLSIHKRHAHDLLADLEKEFWGMILTNRLVAIINQISLTEITYMNCYRELSRKLESKIKEEENLPIEAKQFFYNICRNMRIWVDVCSALKKEK